MKRPLEKRKRAPPMAPATKRTVITAKRTRRRLSIFISPRIAELPSRATVAVCMAATRVPKPELTGPVAKKSWKVSAGILKRSKKYGIALFKLPKEVNSPVKARVGYLADETGASAN